MRAEQAIQKVQELSNNTLYFPAFLHLCKKTNVQSPEDYNEDVTSEVLFQELTYLAGFINSKFIKKEYSESNEQIQAYAVEIEKYLDELHKSFTEDFFERMANIDRDTTKFEDIYPQQEALFYDGVHAYDFQLLKVSLWLYQPYNEQIMEITGLEVKDIVAITEAIGAYFTVKHNQDTEHEFDSYYEELLEFHRIDIEKVSEIIDFEVSKVKKYIELFKIELNDLYDEKIQLGSFTKNESNPIFNYYGTHLLPIWFNLAKSVYESPFFWIKDKISGNAKGTMGEEVTKIVLESTFGKNNVYKNLKFKDVENEPNEIDVLCIHKNTALIVQVKSKKLTKEAITGNKNTLQVDFIKGIEEAYQQGDNCRKLLLEGKTIYSCLTNNEIKFRTPIEHAYVLTITTGLFQGLQYVRKYFFEEHAIDALPLTIFDLEFMMSYLTTPEVLFQYLYQRTATAINYEGQTELDFLYAFLIGLLQDVPDRKTAISTLGTDIDIHYLGMIGRYPPNAKFKKINDRIYGFINSKWKRKDIYKALIKALDADSLAYYKYNVMNILQESDFHIIRKLEKLRKQNKTQTVITTNSAGFSFALGINPTSKGVHLNLNKLEKEYGFNKGIGITINSAKNNPVVKIEKIWK